LEEAALAQTGFVAGAVAPVVVEAVGRTFPLGQTSAVREGFRISVSAVEPAAPIRLGVVRGLPGHWGGDGSDFGFAGRTSINTVGKASHLGVTALAGVAAGRIGKCDYTVERLQERAADDATALVTAEGVAAEGSKFGLRAEGAGNYSGFASGVVHAASLLVAWITP
jgi:hypothetical protein